MQGKFTIVHKILSVFQPFPPEFFPSSGKTSLFPQKFPLAAVFPVPRLPADGLQQGERCPGPVYPEGKPGGKPAPQADFHFQDIPLESPGHGEEAPSHWERTRP